MHQRIDVPTELTRLAYLQGDAISRSQALGLGLSRNVIERLLANDTWRPFDRGLYVARNRDPDWLTHVWGAVLLGGPNTRLHKRTAARLHGLIDADELPIEALVPTGTVRAERSWVRFTRERPGIRRNLLPVEPPRTTVADTVLDLCSEPDADVVSWISTAVQRRLTTPDRLMGAASKRARLANRKLIAAVCSDIAGGVESQLEHEYLGRVERAHDLPTPTRQFRVPGTSRIADAAYVEFGVLIELDGERWHRDRRAADRYRDNAHAASGWVTLRFGWWEVVNDPCGVARQIAAVLRLRGWAGRAACAQCVQGCTA